MQLKINILVNFLQILYKNKFFGKNVIFLVDLFSLKFVLKHIFLFKTSSFINYAKFKTVICYFGNLL